MNWSFKLRYLPGKLKWLVAMFLCTLLFGYGASFIVLSDQTGLSARGIEENYNGNEKDEDARTIKFRKSRFEILTTVHSHVFTLGVIFLITGFLTFFTSFPELLRGILMIEPLLSLIVSFTSLILLWNGFVAFKYLALLSGGVMHTGFITAILLLLWEISRRKE